MKNSSAAIRGQIASAESQPDIVEIVRVIAEASRAAWEPIWPVWKLSGNYKGPLHPASVDTCIPSSFALCHALMRAVPEIRWKVAGGRPTKRNPACGFIDANGIPRPHLWVTGRRGSTTYIADVTADQFGGDRVTVLTGRSDRYRQNATGRKLDFYELHEWSTILLMLEALDLEIRRSVA